MHSSQSKTEAETAAFGYPARALIFEQRVRKGTFGYPRHAPSLTASDGLVLSSRGGDFRSRLLPGTNVFLGGNLGNASRGGRARQKNSAAGAGPRSRKQKDPDQQTCCKCPEA
jgi:hypothetical protein